MMRMTMEERRKFAQKFVTECILGGFLIPEKVDELVKVWNTDIDNTLIDSLPRKDINN